MSFWDSGGADNTASNVGAGGVGPFEGKVGSDLQFRNINAGDTSISVALDAVNNEIDITVGTFNLDDLDDVVITSPGDTSLFHYDNGSSTWVDFTINDLTADASPAGAADYVMTWDASASAHKKVLLNDLPGGGGGGGGFQAELNFKLAGMEVNTTTEFAPIEYIDLGTIEGLVRAFDDTTQEYCQDTFSVPGDIDTSGTVTFEIYGKRASGTSAANIYLDFDHRAVADSEAWDGSYTTESSGAQAVDTTAGDIDRITWTETVTNLGWTANELVEFRLSRDSADAGDTLSGDYYIRNLRILIPRA